MQKIEAEISKPCIIDKHCPAEFACEEECIPEKWVCDGRMDCSDGRDEENCTTTTTIVPTTTTFVTGEPIVTTPETFRGCVDVQGLFVCFFCLPATRLKVLHLKSNQFI